MHAGERFRARVGAYQTALNAARPSAWWARLLAWLGLARLARFFLQDRTWLSVVLADFERHCGARSDQAIFVEDDPNGRISAYNEGHRQAFLHLARLLGIPPLELEREAARLEREEREALEDRIEGEVRKRLRYAA